MEVERRKESPGYVVLKGPVVMALGSGVRGPDFRPGLVLIIIGALDRLCGLPSSADKLSMILVTYGYLLSKNVK